MEKHNTVRPHSREEGNGYPKMYRMPACGYWGAILLCLVAGLIWLFCGTINITVNGYAQLTKGYNSVLLVPSTEISGIKPGQQVWIGSSSGKVTKITKDFDTYEEVEALYGASVKKLHLDPAYTYYYVYADITDEKNGYSPYTVILDTVTPFEQLFGGKNHE